MRISALLVICSLVGCADSEVTIRQLTDLPEHANGYVTVRPFRVTVTEGTAVAFDCETRAGGVCYGLDARVIDPTLALVEQLHLDSDVIRELEVSADRLPTGDSRVFLLVGLQPGETTLQLDHDEGVTEYVLDVRPR